MGIGKYLHRKKGDSPSPQQPNRQSRVISQGNSASGLGTSRYEATAPGSAPETGSYPIRGNNSSAAVTGGKSSIRNSMDNRGPQSARPETAPSRPTSKTAPRLETPPNNHYSDYHFFDHPQASPQTRTQTTTTTTVTRSHPTSRQMEADAGLSQDFSGLNINHDSGKHPSSAFFGGTCSPFSAGASATPPPISYYPTSGSARLDPRVDSHPREDPSIRMVDQPGSQQAFKSPTNYQRAGPGYYDSASRSLRNADKYRSRGQHASQYDSAGDTTPIRSSSQEYNDNPESNIGRRGSIPRKQVGSYAHTPSSSVTSTSPATAGFPTERRDQQAPPVPQHDKPLSQQLGYQHPSTATYEYNPSPRYADNNMHSSPPGRPQKPRVQKQNSPYNSQQSPSTVLSPRESSLQHPVGAGQRSTYPRHTEELTQDGEHLDGGSRTRQDEYVAPLAVRPKPRSRDEGRSPTAEEVVGRAKANTYDTEVIEKIAPGRLFGSAELCSPKLILSVLAVVQETVQEKVHHVREEVITREIHNHDVFHRILPVIDVEVLPPRHFLPVEGGGLVEIGADEVPGRGHTWVIAETASKIPSDQPAPTGARRFTARRFPGTEGDAIQYTTPEGYEHTETTWVHPPELETGGRDTGQTWPMVFGKDTSSDGRAPNDGPPASKHAKSRSKTRSSGGRWTGTGQGIGQQNILAA